MSADLEPGWWIATDMLARGGQPVLGPFIDRDLATKVRALLEQAGGDLTYWIDEHTTRAAS